MDFIKGTVSRDFRLQVFFMIQFPPAPEYPFRTVSNFFENSRRYSQLKVHQINSKVSAVKCSHYLPPVSLTAVANLPPVLTTLALLVENLPPVSLIPVVHLELHISSKIFENFLNDPNAILRGLGDLA